MRAGLARLAPRVALGPHPSSRGLGFALEEIATLLDLADGRNRRAVRAVTSARLEQIRAKLSDLSRMQRTLDELLAHCVATGEVHPCPIIEALMANGGTA
ncbi:MAG: MerR family DNA-binding protein [Rubrivivax sp.]|nr:MerR family DNA-binding protein [Rubrivivax sp.]MDP3082351.1 MerR family DNA-binding protein [Rubrivivax sp.]